MNQIIASYQLSKTNKEGFERLRDVYNRGQNDWVTLFTLMCYSFNGQFRFNSKREYNSSFGMNRSTFTSAQKDNIYKMKKKLCTNITVFKKSFRDIDLSKLTQNDFVYCDPPYLNSVGNYNDGKRGFEGWTKVHEYDLYAILNELTERNVRWALSNNLSTNDLILEFATKNAYKIHYLGADYSNCNYQKKDKNKAEEILVVNY